MQKYSITLLWSFLWGCINFECHSFQYSIVCGLTYYYELKIMLIWLCLFFFINFKEWRWKICFSEHTCYLVWLPEWVSRFCVKLAMLGSWVWAPGSGGLTVLCAKYALHLIFKWRSGKLLVKNGLVMVITSRNMVRITIIPTMFLGVWISTNLFLQVTTSISIWKRGGGGGAFSATKNINYPIQDSNQTFRF